MKLRRLTLARFGHLKDVTLDLSDPAPLHVVFGANEAGKTTALAAIGDALFGFPIRSRHGFLHGNPDLRLDIEVEAAGALRCFTRLKRAKHDLLDEAEQPVSEAALEALRGTLSRDGFEHVFGLSGESLRRGGEDILAGRGHVGTMLFQASSGLHTLPAAVQRLRQQADALYTPRRHAERAFYVAKSAHEQAAADLRARTIGSDAYDRAVEERTRLEKARTADEAQQRALSAERRRLDRIRRTAQPLRDRALAQDELQALGPAPPMPTDAFERREAALIARQQAADSLERVVAQHKSHADRLATLQPDPAILREASAIDRLLRDLNRIEAAREDRDKIGRLAEEHARAIERHAQALGVPGAAPELAASLPTALERQALRRAARDHAALTERRDTATRLLREAEAKVEALTRLRDGIGQPADPAPLRMAVETVRAEGRLDAERESAAAKRDEIARDGQRALSALPGWTGDAARLAATPVPLGPELHGRADALTAAEQATHDAARDLAARRGEVEAGERQVADARAGGDLPTDEAIGHARGRRDLAWRLIRRERVDAGAAPAPAELAEVPAMQAADLPDALDRLIRDADRLADRRTSEADRLATHAAACSELDRRRRALDCATATHEAAERVMSAARDAWRALWSATGVEAQSPRAMVEWLAQREAVLGLLRREEAAGQDAAAVERRCAAARDALRLFVPVTDRILPALTALEAQFKRADEASRAAQQAGRAVLEAEAGREACAVRLQGVGRAMDEWEARWPAVAGALRLPPTTEPADADVALAAWEAMDAAVQQWGADRARVAEMTDAIIGFEAEVAEVAGRAAPDLAAASAASTIAAMGERLHAAQAQRDEATRLAAELKRFDGEAAEARQRQSRAAGDMAALCELAGVADEHALPDAIARARRRAALLEEIKRCQDALRAQEHGGDFATLAAEVEGQDLDACRTRVEQIDADLAGVQARVQDTISALTLVRAELDQMALGRDAAEAQQRIEDAAQAAREAASRYAVLRLAGDLLNAGLARFRQDQQAPLLRRAAEHFRTLTLGRYVRLEEGLTEDGKNVIAAIRDNGHRCPVDALSEGTRDQLYLALRLAWIEAHAADADPLPFIADDLLVHFDDARALAGMRVLAELGRTTQTILFTHHDHIAAMVTPDIGVVHRLPPP